MGDNATTFMVEDARLIWRNFSGAPTPFNPDGGKRTFNVVLDKETADKMSADGWNVKCKPAGEPADEGEDGTDEEFCYLEVAVGYKVRPPMVVCITDTSRTKLTEETIGMLDWVDIRTVDFEAKASYWEVGAKRGVKAYLQKMYITIEESALDRKYNQMLEGMPDEG